MFNECHCLSKSMSGLRFIAAKPDHTQPSEAIARRRHAVPLRKPLHVSVDSYKDRLIQESRSADEFVGRPVRKSFTMEDHKVPALL
jgi:hypothetical protein